MRDGVLLCSRVSHPTQDQPGSKRKLCGACGHPVWVFLVNLVYDASIVCGPCAAGRYLGRVIAKAEEVEEVA